MRVAPYQWLIAFIIACALHVAVGSAIWLAGSMPQTPRHAPRGVMVSLDSLMAGNQARVSTTPEPVKPVPASPTADSPATQPQIPTAATPASSPAMPTSPAPVVPEPANPAQPTSAGAPADAGGVDIPVANAVTVDAADTLQALEQASIVRASPPRASTAGHLGSGARGRSTNPTMTYIGRIRVWLSRHKYYPRAARTSGAQGTVRLYLVVDRQGNVLNVAVADSSGSPILDQAAKDMVKRAEPLPPMSEDMLRTRLEIILPVRYTLGNTRGGAAATTK